MVGILRWDGQCSLRNIQVCILKIFGLKLSLGFVYEEVKSVCQKAKLINEEITYVDLKGKSKKGTCS